MTQKSDSIQFYFAQKKSQFPFIVESTTKYKRSKDMSKTLIFVANTHRGSLFYNLRKKTHNCTLQNRVFRLNFRDRKPLKTTVIYFIDEKAAIQKVSFTKCIFNIYCEILPR